MAYKPFPSFAEWASHTIDEVVYDRFAALLQRAKEAAVPDDLTRAVQTATRFAAVDTGAIEGLYDVDRGFTRTVATEAAAWEAAANARGEHVVRAIEDALHAYEYVLDLATRRERLTEAVMREMHAIICRSQETYTVHTSQGQREQPLPKGEYKKHPNSPTNLSTGRIHHYAPVSDTPAEMHRLTTELASDAFAAAHPVVQAAYAHYAFVCIHPFADGNGRVARALASAFLYRSPGVPLLVFADQKDAYFDALEAAEAGKFALFNSFVLDRVVDAIQLVRSFLHSTPVPPLAQTVATYRTYQAARRGLTYNELDALNVRLLGLVEEEFEKQLAIADLGGLGFSVFRELGTSASRGPTATLEPPEGYERRRSGQLVLNVSIHGGPPAELGVNLDYAAFVAAPDHDGPDFVVTGREHVLEALEVFIRDISPTVTHVLELKIAAWVERNISWLAREVVESTQRRLQELGYLPSPPSRPDA